MSRENVGVVRRVSEIFQSERDLGAAFDRCVREGLIAPNAEWRGGARGGRAVAGMENVVGRDGYVDMMRRFAEGFEDLGQEFERIIDAGDDHVVVVARVFGTGKVSGAPVEWRLAYVFWLEAGRITRTDPYMEPDEALKAVGLRE